MRRFVFALLLAVWAGPAAAASFDCEQAAAPVERLICADGTATRLDDFLAETFAARREAAKGEAGKALLAEQRQWLKDRLTACGIPAKGPAPSLEQRWNWTPCLVEQMRTRLVQLGADEQPVDLLPEASSPDFIHPVCLDLALGDMFEGSEPQPVPLAACNKGNRHSQVSGEVDGGLAANISAGGYVGVISYLPSGRLPDGREVLLVSRNGGGSGTFSSVHAAERKGGVLRVTPLAGGGDRCNGGIDSVAVEGGKSLRIVSHVSPADLFGLVGIEDDGLILCAACCFATVTHLYPISGEGEGKFISAKLNPRDEVKDFMDDKSSACLLGLLSRTGLTTLSPAELKAVGEDYKKKCAGRGGN